MKGLRSTAFAAIATLGTLSVPPLMAQTDGPAYVRHVMTTVKPERVAEFESLLEERAATLRESGQQGFRNVYESVQGDRYTYLIEDPVPSIATLDEPPAAMPSLDWTRRVQEAVTAQRSVIIRAYPDLSIPAGAGTEPGLVHYRLRRNIPARTQEYYQWQANELVPAMRESGRPAWFFTGRVIAGGSPQSWISLAHVDNWASLEVNNFAETMTPAERGQMFSRGSSVLSYAEDSFFRFRPDLSFAAD